jgi:diguanylate cyclase (GGDEF)-like protein
MLRHSSQDVVGEGWPLFVASMQKRVGLGAIQWLILSAAALVIAIMLGTAYFAMQYRERALEVAERQLNNTALLLSRHFDQQLLDLQHVQEDVISGLRADGVNTADEFERKMSTLSAHEMLRSKLSVLPHVGALNLWSAKGWLINSSEMWPVADATVTDRYYFKEFTSGRPTPDVIVEPVVSKVTKVWTTAFARRIIGREGQIIGFAVRGVEPSHFEAFVGSLALDGDTAISMIHRNGTIIARYPQDPKLIGHNVANTEAFQIALARDGNVSGRFTSARLSEDKVGAVKSLMHFPILIIATTRTETALADWRAQARLQFFAAALAIIVVIGMVFLIVRQLRHQHAAAQAKLSEKSLHLDTAISNMTQGLLLFDPTGRLVICNRQYVDMFGLSPDVVKPGVHLRDLLRHRRERGSFDGDIEAYCARFLDPQGSLVSDTFTATPDGRTIRLIFKRLPDGGWATTLEDVTEGRRDQARIEHLAHYDALTNLPNRSLFQRHAEGLLLETEGRAFAILYIDIDEFKRINDTLGHLIGDEFLKGVAERLRQSVGPEDFIARLGGDEFAILQNGIAGAEDVHALVARIYQALRTPFDCNGHQLSSDASIGIAIAPRDGSDLFDLLKNADLAMYAAKTAGRRTYRFFDPEMEQRANHRRELEADLRTALAEGGFELHYQPQVDLGDDRVTGCEALLRWRHPVRGMVSPADFVPVAEETGLIEEIGQWVLRTACTEAAKCSARRRCRSRSPRRSPKAGSTRAGWSSRSPKPC